MPEKEYDLSEHRSSYISMLNKIEEIPVNYNRWEKKRKLVETIVRKGNLQEKDYDDLQTILVKIEEFKIK